MIALMTRSAAEFWGIKIPDDAACLVKKSNASPLWESVAWNEVLEERRRKQARILAFKREHSTLRAVRVSVRWFEIEVYGGWHAYIDGVDFSKWWRDEDERLMELFPMPQPSLFVNRWNRWREWMEWFARTYKRGTFDKHPRGVAYCWALCDGEGRDTSVREIVGVIR